MSQQSLPNAESLTVDALAFAKHIESRAEASQITVLRGEANAAPVLVVPRGLELQSPKRFLDEMRQRPERRSGTATLLRLADFIAHVNRFKSPDTAIFVDPAKPSLLAIYDYHPEGGDVFVANNRGHGARHMFPFSAAFTAWRNISGKKIDAKAFAMFLTERAAEILAPSNAVACSDDLASLDLTVGTPDVMRRLAKGLRVSVSEEFEEARALESGDVALSFTRKTNSTKDAKGQEIKVPGGFVIGVPVTDGAQELTAIPAMLRFDHDDALTWTITLLHLEALMERIVNEAAARVLAETGCPVFFGSQEA